MWEKLKKLKTILLFIAALAAGAVLSYFFNRYQAFQQIQAASIIVQASLTENSYEIELLHLGDQEYKLMADCLNNYSACDYQKTVNAVAAINDKKAVVIKREKENMAKILTTKQN